MTPRKSTRSSKTASRRDAPVRFAVVGVGHIAQVAVLPAFRNARRDAELVALITDDPKKQDVLRRRTGVEHTSGYDEMEATLAASRAEAVYIALPNHLHADFAVRAARAGMHVLCEKPMAVSTAECRRMQNACDRANVRLMIAYRLHFDDANLLAVQQIAQQRIGDAKLIHATLTIRVRDDDNIRLGPRDKGGGPLYDLGIYCINAGRYLFRDEPIEAMAWTSEARTAGGTEETFVGMLRFPNDRILTLSASVATAAVSTFRVIGTRGDLRIDGAFDYAKSMQMQTTIDDQVTRTKFRKSDQFAPQLIHFARCIRQSREPQASGHEGIADVRVIEALYRAADRGRPVRLPPMEPPKRPDLRLAKTKPPVRKVDEIRARSPRKKNGK